MSLYLCRDTFEENISRIGFDFLSVSLRIVNEI